MPATFQAMQVIQAFEQVVELTRTLASTIRTGGALSATMFTPYPDPLRGVASTYSALWYEHDGDGREMLINPGVVFVTPDCASIIKSVNVAKGEFASLCHGFRDHTKEIEAMLGNSMPFSRLREEFNAAACGRVHLKQTYRSIVLLDDIPASVRIYRERSGWEKQSAPMTVEQAIGALLKMGDGPHIQIQIKQLESLPPGELLVRRRKAQPRLKCYVSKAGCGQAAPVCAGMPLAITVPPGGEWRECRLALDLNDTGEPVARPGRCKFEDEPFAPSISLFRYKPEHRECVA